MSWLFKATGRRIKDVTHNPEFRGMNFNRVEIMALLHQLTGLLFDDIASAIDAYLDRTTSGLLREEINLFLEKCYGKN